MQSVIPMQSVSPKSSSSFKRDLKRVGHFFKRQFHKILQAVQVCSMAPSIRHSVEVSLFPLK